MHSETKQTTKIERSISMTYNGEAKKKKKNRGNAWSHSEDRPLKRDYL